MMNDEGISMIRPRMLHPCMFRSSMFCPRTKRPRTLYPDVFASPYISALKELGCSKHLFPVCYVPVPFIPQGKGCILKLVFSEEKIRNTYCSKTQIIPPTYELVGHVA